MASNAVHPAPMSPPKAGAKVKTEKDTLEAGVLSMVREGEVGALLLAPGEVELKQWDLEIKVFSPHDKVFDVLTLGLYSCLNKGSGLKKRRVRLTLTDRRLLFKETFFQKVPTQKEEYWEAQQSMNLVELSYVRFETGAASFLQSAYLVVDMHFFSYPSELAPTLYESWGSMIFRPLVDTMVVALDDATGGLYTQIKLLSKGNVDPMALLQAMSDAQQAAMDAMADPTSFMLNVMYYFFKEALRRFKEWLREMFKLLKAIMLGLVPIATLPALLLGADKEGGQAANVVSLKMYQDDDPAFVQNVESFLAAVVDARDALYPAALPAAPPTALQSSGKDKGKKVSLPAFMYAFVLQNASVQFAGQMKPFMRALDQLYCILSFGIYYITDLQGILDHSGALVMTDRTLSTSAVKYKGSSTTALDHARLDVWFLDTVKMHALDTKWDVLNDMKNVLTVGANFGTIIVDITQLRTGDSQGTLRKLLSLAMDTKTRLDVPVSPTLPPDVNKYVTLSMLKSTETVLSVWQCQEYQSLFGKLMSLGLAETTVTTCAITDSRLVYKSQGVNCRGKRKEWELSVPLSVVSSVLWSNYYQRTNKIFNLFKSLPIPCKSCFLVCCLACPLQDDRKEHFWMGKPGVNVSIVLGRSNNYGASMQGEMIWFCSASHDAVTESINNLTALQYQNAALPCGRLPDV